MLNLIPHTLEDDLAKEHHIAIVLRASIIICITILLCAGILYASNQWLHAQLADIDHLLYQPNQLATIDSVTNTNARITTINSVQKKYTEWSELLGDITAVIPSGISITYITVSATNETFEIKGDAKTREDLTTLKSALERTEHITSVSAPLSNFLEQTDIHFQFTGTLNTTPYQKGTR